jgi:hypothetical protein
MTGLMIACMRPLPTGVLFAQSLQKKRHEPGLLDSSFACELKEKVRLGGRTLRLLL